VRKTIISLGALALTAAAGNARDLPPFEKVSEGYEKVVSTVDGLKPMYSVYFKKKDNQLLAALPKNFASQKFFVIATVAGGDPQMGVYSIWNNRVGTPAKYLYWKRHGDTLMLMEPNLAIRSTGDQENKSATKRIYTDRLVLTVPVVAKGPDGGPVIDLDNLMLKNSGSFFGGFTRGARTDLAEVESVKAFPGNIEVTFKMPIAGGRMAKIHYSIGIPPKDASYKPREADRRVGFFYTNFADRSVHDREGATKRYINRWNLEKADSKLKMSPPKQPIVYYIEHTTPVRYRRWVREGILSWNKAFEQAGIINAIEVYQQDATSGAHMDKDPEDMRYSFVRWTNSNMGFAIGPVHAHPETGQIFEADIVMDEGFISSWARAHKQSLLASAAMMYMEPETVDWLEDHPRWDPRYRLADPSDQPEVLRYMNALSQGTADPLDAPPTMLPGVWNDPRDAPRQGLCMASPAMAANVEMMRIAVDAGLVKIDAKDGESVLDGLPESFVGPLLRDVIMHEVGHTMGLMHNWKGSSSYSFAEMNSEDFKGNKPILTSVMDYAPTNITVEDGDLIQGDYTSINIGPYDMWAISWGYTDKPDEVIKLSTKPEHGFTSDEGSRGPDPHAKVWDLGENSLDFADSEMRFVRKVRKELLDKVVEDGDSWKKARDGFNTLLYKQTRAMGTASNWIGGVYFNRFHKGDENAPAPVRPVEVERQRRALEFILNNGFDDKAFGLTPEILARLGAEQWFDGAGGRDRADVPIHDTVLGVQASAMTMLMNPTRLGRVLDNELRTPDGQDALTVPEIFELVQEKVWSSLKPVHGNGSASHSYTARDPMISSLQRNLQREYLDRMIALAVGTRWPNASYNTVTTLARDELRQVDNAIEGALEKDMDAYSHAHLVDARERISRALEAAYIRQD
jgi:uncharacterized protein DUF4953/uncharacterized protein DUF5117